jgi:hypothetical protein
MDLVSACVNLQHAGVVGRVQMAVARKVLEMQNLQGNAAIQLIEAATDGVSRAGDAVTAAATGLGGEIDVYG